MWFIYTSFEVFGTVKSIEPLNKDRLMSIGGDPYD